MVDSRTLQSVLVRVLEGLRMQQLLALRLTSM